MVQRSPTRLSLAPPFLDSLWAGLVLADVSLFVSCCIHSIVGIEHSSGLSCQDGYYAGRHAFEQFTHWRVSLDNPSWYVTRSEPCLQHVQLRRRSSVCSTGTAGSTLSYSGSDSRRTRTHGRRRWATSTRLFLPGRRRPLRQRARGGRGGSCGSSAPSSAVLRCCSQSMDPLCS